MSMVVRKKKMGNAKYLGARIRCHWHRRSVHMSPLKTKNKSNALFSIHSVVYVMREELSRFRRDIMI